MNRLLLWLTVVCFIGALSSCSLFRRGANRSKLTIAKDSTQAIALDSTLYPVDSAIGNETAIATPELDAKQAALLSGLAPLWTRQRSWNTFNGRAKTHFEGRGENHDFTATIRMQRGSRIWISVVALGVMEAFRVMITPDSVQIMDRLHKEYMAMPFDQLGALLPVRGDFTSLQNILIGDPINTSYRPNAALDTVDSYLLSHVSANLTHILAFNKADSTLRLQTITAPDVLLISNYDNYSIEAGSPFANRRSLSMRDAKDQHLIEMDFNKAAFNEIIETPFTIPDKYNRK